MKSLAVKYRPIKFEDVVEQGPIIDILTSQIQSNEIKNCYLFTGGAGTGKTTCARIFERTINKCHGNAIEIDAASNNGVDDIRDIRANASFKAIGSEYRVYIIDECHMLSTGAWNALLKLLEEPPAKTIFIMCTTDPQKIPATILSRVQRYDFKRISFAGILKRLRYIIDAENDEICESRGNEIYPEEELLIDADQDALGYITKIADGGMRDAITLMDKCISYSTRLSMENVVKALGTINYETMFKLTESLFGRKMDETIKVVEDIHQEGMDLKQFIKQYSNFILDLCKYELLKSFDYISLPSTLEAKMAEMAVTADDYVNELHKLLNCLIRLTQDIKWEDMPKPVIQMRFLMFCGGES